MPVVALAGDDFIPMVCCRLTWDFVVEGGSERVGAAFMRVSQAGELAHG